MNGLWTILGALGVSGLVAAIPALIGTLRSLKANQPKTAAEAESAQAMANRTNIETQTGIIGNLRAELERQSAVIGRLEAKVANLELKREEAEKQENLQAEALAAAERRNRELQDQKRVLTADLQAFSAWATEFYAAGHPPGMRPPPQFHG